MGGFSTGQDDHGHPLAYGDVCNVETSNGILACTFVETSDDGDRWFRLLCDHDNGPRGWDTFPDYFQEVWDVRFSHTSDDPTPDIGSGI